MAEHGHAGFGVSSSIACSAVVADSPSLHVAWGPLLGCWGFLWHRETTKSAEAALDAV